MNWRDFELAAPEFAKLGRERLERTNVALLGTLRSDGSPRISPIGPYVVQGHLLLGVMHSEKQRDLARDPRCVLHGSVSQLNGSEGEFKLFGRALPVTDPAILEGDYEAWWKDYPADRSHVYWFDIESAVLVEWQAAAGQFEVRRWSPETGIKRTVARYP